MQSRCLNLPLAPAPIKVKFTLVCLLKKEVHKCKTQAFPEIGALAAKTEKSVAYIFRHWSAWGARP